MDNSSNLCNMKEVLIKYCYIQGTEEHNKLSQQLLRLLLNEATNDFILQFMYEFFMKYIMPFYFPCRTEFNIIRSKFMLHLLSILIRQELTLYDMLICYRKFYYEWSQFSVSTTSQLASEIAVSLKSMCEIDMRKYFDVTQMSSKV